jgi:uracil-DNA glycosylase
MELNNLPDNTIVLALGLVAHSALLIALDCQKNKYKFSHGGRHVLPNKLVLYNSYHCSRYNTQTKRLTEKMFEDIFLSIKNEMEN